LSSFARNPEKELKMSLRFALPVLATLIALNGAAHATSVILTGGPLYGSVPVEGGIVTCRIFNAGAATGITSRQIYDNTGALVALQGDTCGGRLQTRKTCAFYAGIPGTLAYSCRAVYPGPATLTGNVELQDSNQRVLFTLPMQNVLP
jgi:hypothetical protein